MSFTADDSQSQPVGVNRSTTSQHIVKENKKQEGYDNQDNESVRERQDNGDSLQNPATLPETDLLGLGVEAEVNYDVTDAMATDNSKSELPISDDRNRVGDDDKHEVIYDFPPGLSTLNVNGRPRFELETVRENGRLQIFMVPNLSPQLVRSSARNGRLKMWLLNDDQLTGEKALPPVRRSI
ncbi:hypothetical protein E3N88_11429 [Mikania micrantha]|uniref:FAF domain-containing protein n=1 Tax=Mikania micrantha TaxID=192012 RepID=A0A5N6PEF4_9ASTR|nr:hypothetical protein E3N88_11429 [Mikania micrantha]